MSSQHLHESRRRFYQGTGLAHGFTLMELLVVLVVIAIVAAILFPVFAKARENARGSACLSNLRQLGTALTLYVQDNDETFPLNRFPDAAHPLGGCISPGPPFPIDGLEGSSVNWKRAVLPYVKSIACWQCPSNNSAWSKNIYSDATGDEGNLSYPTSERLPASYALNGSFFHEAVPPCWLGERLARGRRLTEIDALSTLILLTESRWGFPDLGTWMISQPSPTGKGGSFQSHNGFCNWLFADGHAKRLKLAATCRDKMWTDRAPDKSQGCQRIGESAEEYR